MKLKEICPVSHYYVCESVAWLLVLVLVKTEDGMGLDVRVDLVVVILLIKKASVCAIHLDELDNKILE